MTAQQQIAAAVMPIVERWLNTCPGQPLVLRADPCGESVEVNIGLGDKRRVTAIQAAEILGISAKTFSRHGFYGLCRGTDKKFSRLAVERQRDAMR
jgi:hypothetical protein